MTGQTQNKQPKPEHIHPSPLQETNKHKQKAEELEIAGRHKNVGQKDHKGAR